MCAYILIAAASYLLGSIPFGFLVAKTKSVDIRKVGSCNIGATNVFRTLGKGPGILTFVLDALKGFVSAFWIPSLAVMILGGEVSANMKLLGGLCAVVGHTWPLFLGFKGGKGVATSAGMLLGIVPSAVGIAFAVWVLFFLLTRYVSVASIAAAIALGSLVWIPRFYIGLPSAILLSLLAIAVVLRHRSNICRLAKGRESRFSFTKKQKVAEEARRASWKDADR